MTYELKNCLHCNTVFKAATKELKRGYGKFCSRSCGAKYNGQKYIPEPNMTCSYCQAPMYKNTSKQKNSKSGFLFCSRLCKDQAQQLENVDIFRDMMPDHYGFGQSHYREIAFRHKTMECEECNYKKCPEILEVHHIDRNRQNNSIENLKVLCPTCHMEDHFLNRDGKWRVGGP